MQSANYKIFLQGVQKDDNGWEHFAWSIHLGPVVVLYKTGLGHASKAQGPIPLKPKSEKKKCMRVEYNGQVYFAHVPKLNNVLYSLAMDAQCGAETFQDFCSNFGYDIDSRKALAIYEACQDSGIKLRKVMRSENYLQRILDWEL